MPPHARRTPAPTHRCLAWVFVLALTACEAAGSVLSCTGSCANATTMCSQLYSSNRGGLITATSCSISGGSDGNFTGSVSCRCSPSGVLSSNDIEVTATWDPFFGTCNRSEVFESGAWGTVCSPTTNVAPSRLDCKNTSSYYSALCASKTLTCTTLKGATSESIYELYGVNATLQLQCYACDASLVLMYVDESLGTFMKTYVAPTGTCSPQTTCNGHGCCAPVSDGTSAAVGTCSCYQDATRGFWSSTYSCSTCASEYESSGVVTPCTNSKPQIVVLLQSLGASPATMILPNLIVVSIFVLIGMIRRVWPSDDTFESTIMRRAGLPWCDRQPLSLDDPNYIVLPLLHPHHNNSHNGEGRFFDGAALAGDNDKGLLDMTGGASQKSAAAFHSGMARSAPSYAFFRKKDIPKRPLGSVGVVNRWEQVQAEQLRRAR